LVIQEFGLNFTVPPFCQGFPLKQDLVWRWPFFLGGEQDLYPPMIGLTLDHATILLQRLATPDESGFLNHKQSKAVRMCRKEFSKFQVAYHNFDIYIHIKA